MNINKPDKQLIFIADDCYKAIQACPLAVKTPYYYDLAKACLKEITRRDEIRIHRNNVKILLNDHLKYQHSRPINGKGAHHPNDWIVFNDACFAIGFSKLNK